MDITVYVGNTHATPLKSGTNQCLIQLPEGALLSDLKEKFKEELLNYNSDDFKSLIFLVNSMQKTAETPLRDGDKITVLWIVSGG